MALPTDTLAAIADVSVAFAPPPIAALPDRDLMNVLGDLGEIKRRADAVASIVAAELDRRSRPELGHEGLAQRLGVRTGAKLVQRLAGVTTGEAHQLVRVGEITAPVTVDSAPDLPSWLPVALGGAAAVLVLLKLLIGADVNGAGAAEAFGVSIDVSRSFGIFVALLAAIGMAAAGFLKMQEQPGGAPSTGGTAPPQPF
jgi:hypothetical protein